jgi:hypothetical protein
MANIKTAATDSLNQSSRLAAKAQAPEVLDNIGGAVLIGGCLVFQPFLRPYFRQWGATKKEAVRTLPGDEYTPEAQVVQTMAVTVQAPAAAVWPWVAQIGQERGGLYSYELLENLAGCQMHNADRPMPEWELREGDAVRLGPPGYPAYVVAELQREQYLLLDAAAFEECRPVPAPGPGDKEYVKDSWVIYLDEQADGNTRLISRHRTEYAPKTFSQKLIWEWTTEPIGSVMTHRMLLGIKERAERR